MSEPVALRLAGLLAPRFLLVVRHGVRERMITVVEFPQYWKVFVTLPTEQSAFLSERGTT